MLKRNVKSRLKIIKNYRMIYNNIKKRLNNQKIINKKNNQMRFNRI